MDFELDAIIVLLMLWVAATIGGTVDTFQFSADVWDEAGYSRASWMWQAAVAVFLPGALVYSGIYYLRVRPRLRAAERAIAASDPDYRRWAARTRWYDRFSRARRSPYEWDKAARRWWLWIPSALTSITAALFYLWVVTSHSWFGGAWTGYTLAALLSLSGLLSAAKAGFWYGEQMRLTGRRPERGGALMQPPTEVPGRPVKPKAR